MQKPPERPSEFAAEPAGKVARAVIAELTETQPWVVLIATLGTLAGVASLLLGGWMTYLMLEEDSADIGAVPIFGSLTYAVLFLLPASRLWKWGTFISRLKHSETVDDLELTLQAQRQFWKLVGILGVMLVALMLYSLFEVFYLACTVGLHR